MPRNRVRIRFEALAKSDSGQGGVNRSAEASAYCHRLAVVHPCTYPRLVDRLQSRLCASSRMLTENLLPVNNVIEKTEIIAMLIQDEVS